MSFLPPTLQKFEQINCPNLSKTLFNEHLQKLPDGLIIFKLSMCTNLNHQGFSYLPNTIKYYYFHIIFYTTDFSIIILLITKQLVTNN